MPPKIKFTKEDVFKAAIELVEVGGWANLTAKNLAQKLKASVVPIYREYSSLLEIRRDIVRQGLKLLDSYLDQHYSDISILNFAITGAFFTLEHKALSGALQNLGPEYEDILLDSHKGTFHLIRTDPFFKGVGVNRLSMMYFHTLIYTKGFGEMIRAGQFDGYSREGVANLINEAMSILILATTEQVIIDKKWDNYHKIIEGPEDSLEDTSV